MAANENTGNSVLGFTYVFTAIACSSLSAFSTFTGFRIMPPVVAALLSAVIFVLLMACDFSILSARRNGGGLLRVPRTLLGPTAMLLLVTVVSTSSSFTFFYSIAMRDRLAAARAVAAGEAFERNYASALKELQSLGSATSKQHNIELALTNLDTQVLHSGRPGFGTEAQIIIRQIYKMMEEAGAPMTPMAFPKPPGTSIDNEIALNRLRTAVNQNLEAAKAGDGVSPSIARITHIHDSLEPTVQEARDDFQQPEFRRAREGHRCHQEGDV